LAKDSKNLGPEAEDAVGEAMVELCKEDPRFLGYAKAETSDRLDRDGIDGLIFIRGGFVLPLQVRSTRRKIHKFKTIHPLVRFVLVIRKAVRNEDALDKNNQIRYRGTLDYIKRQIKEFVYRATRDAAKDFLPCLPAGRPVPVKNP